MVCEGWNLFCYSNILLSENPLRSWFALTWISNSLGSMNFGLIILKKEKSRTFKSQIKHLDLLEELIT